MAQEKKYEYPSRMGSHASMVVKDNGDGTVVCEDEFGKYTTEKKRLDNGAADPTRYATSRPGFARWLGSHKEDKKKEEEDGSA